MMFALLSGLQNVEPAYEIWCKMVFQDGVLGKDSGSFLHFAIFAAEFS